MHQQCQVFVIRTVSPLPDNLGSPSFGPHIDHGEYMSTRYLSHDLDLILMVFWPW